MKKYFKSVKEFWDRLPKPVKVACYMLVGQLLAQVVKDLTDIQATQGVYLGIFINFVIVLLEYGKKEVENYRLKTKRAKN